MRGNRGAARQARGSWHWAPQGPCHCASLPRMNVSHPQPTPSAGCGTQCCGPPTVGAEEVIPCQQQYAVGSGARRTSDPYFWIASALAKCRGSSSAAASASLAQSQPSEGTAPAATAILQYTWVNYMTRGGGTVLAVG
jgi:hypothetical protein